MLLDSLLIYDMCEVRITDHPMRGMRDYIVRVVLKILAGDVQQKVYKFDFGKLSDVDEEEIHAVCDAAFDFIFLDTEFTPGDGEWNGNLSAGKNVFNKQVQTSAGRFPASLSAVRESLLLEGANRHLPDFLKFFAHPRSFLEP